MLRLACLLLLACALAQSQAVKLYARSAELPATEDIEDEVEDPEPEGRVISFFREQEPPRYQFDPKPPIVITAPAPAYPQPIYTQPAPPPPPPQPPVVYPAPQPYPQPIPQPFPQPVPVPVPVQFPVPPPPPPPSTTIIKPIITRPHHDHHHHDKRPSYRPPIPFPFFPNPLPSLSGAVFNFTYAPVLASTTTRTGNNDLIRGTEQQQYNDINQIAQLFSQLQQQQQPQLINPTLYTSQSQLPQFQQYAQIQQLLQQQQQQQQLQSQFANQAPQSQSVAVPTSLLLQALAGNQQQLPSNLPANFALEALQQQLAESDGGRRKYRPADDDDFVVRRSKPKKKSKKSKKNKGQAKQVIFLALDSAEAAEQAQAQAQAQADLLQ